MTEGPVRQEGLVRAIAASADPAAARRAVQTFAARWPAEWERISGRADTLRRCLAVFTHSRFLSDACLQNPSWILELPPLDRMPGTEEYAQQLRPETAHEGGDTALLLARFRRRSILRILLRDVLGYSTVAETAQELSDLADAILQVAYEQVRRQCVARYGTPLTHAEDGAERECGMAVIALGKLGGSELNYSSDIDVMFLYAGGGETHGGASISNKEFFHRLANDLTTLLSTYTAEGFPYRVDLRLRPDGRLGEVCLSLEGARHYYEHRARDWELQMLIKARVCAGDRATGRALLASVEPLIYSTSLDFSAIEAVSLTRERISEKLARRRAPKGSIDVKLAPGGIRDIEFLVQCLQRIHGGREPWVRHTGTLLALARLRDKDLLSTSDFARLSSAYEFLRHLEHRLQFDEDRQTHTLPATEEELDRLARKMPQGSIPQPATGARLVEEVLFRLNAVEEVYARVIHSEVSSGGRPRRARAPASATPGQRALPVSRAWDHFAEKIAGNGEWADLAAAGSPVGAGLQEVFRLSPYLAEELVRTPDLIEVMADIFPSGALPDRYDELFAAVPDTDAMRRLFRREMFRLQAASFCWRMPIFDTLARSSELADAAIATAYRVAFEEFAGRVHGDAAQRPQPQLMVIALGRLGMREFDIASDADLIFALPDDCDDAADWTRVAGRTIDLLTAYTGTGTLFAVDTRLRPNGSAGPLVASEHAYKSYFANHAEAWEGISYLKARAVAGDSERATRFLNELQEVDWRRYGQSGRSKGDLRHMRLRLEAEHGAAHPLKAGAGGFYDIDFVLLFLRLKSAGLFFKVLNTPQRIDIIEKIGHLDRPDAEFLQEAATFFRVVDHCLRLHSGQSASDLPRGGSQLEAVTELVSRWAPERLRNTSLTSAVDGMRAQTRELFNRLFG